MKKLLLLTLFAFLTIAVQAQYRMVGFGTWTAHPPGSDSTWVAEVSLKSDLTGFEYFGTHIADTMKVFTSLEQLYTIDSIGYQTLWAAQLYIKFNSSYRLSDNGPPLDQVLIFDPAGRSTIPLVPLNDLGSTDQLYAAINTYNARLIGSAAAVIVDTTGLTYINTPNVDGAFLEVDNKLIDLTQTDVTYSSTIDLAKSTASTGIISGGEITINGLDNSKFDVAAGVGYIVDHSTVPATVQLVNFGPFSAVTLTNLATSFATDIAINSSGNIVQQNTFSNAERRNLILLGGLDHSNQVNISNVFELQVPANGIGSNLAEFARAVGDLNLSGNVFGPNGANLQMNKSSGTAFKYGSQNTSNPNDPHTIAQGLQAPVTFNYVFSNGLGGSTFGTDRTNIDPNNYDNGTGILASVPVNNFSIQRLLMFANSGSVFVQYGSETFNKKSDAVAGLSSTAFENLPGIRSAIVRGYLIVQEGATDLSDINQAEFIEADKFGGIGARDGGGGTVIWGNITGTVTDQTDLMNYLSTNYDGSVTNEGLLDVAAGAANTSIITSNTSGSPAVTLKVGTGLSISETADTITLTNTVTNTNIYNTNGSITADRSVFGNGNTLLINGMGSAFGGTINMSDASNALTFTSGATIAGVSASAGTGSLLLVDGTNGGGELTVVSDSVYMRHDLVGAATSYLSLMDSGVRIGVDSTVGSDFFYVLPYTPFTANKFMGDSNGDGILEAITLTEANISDLNHTINTDNQTLSFATPNLSISGGNSVDLSALLDADGNGIFDPANNGGSVPTGFSAIVDTLTFIKTNNADKEPALVLQSTTGFFGSGAGLNLNVDPASEGALGADYELLNYYWQGTKRLRFFNITDIITFQTLDGMELNFTSAEDLDFSAANKLVFAHSDSMMVLGPIPYDATADSLLALTPTGKVTQLAIADVGASQLSDLTDVVSATNTNRFVLVANGTTGYVGRALVEADISDLQSYLTAEVDGSITNEGSLDVAVGTATTSVITSNTSGSPSIYIEAGTGLSISETADTITLTNTVVNTDAQDLGYTASTGTVTITGGSDVTIGGFGTANTNYGFVIGSNSVVGAYLNSDGTWDDLDADISANTDVAANTTARHNAVTLAASATTGGLSLITQEIGFQAATGAQNGYLTSTDWTTFNNKLSSEVDGSVTNEGSLDVGVGTATTSVITSNTSGSPSITLAAGSGLSISEVADTITYTLDATGNWTGTFDGQEGTYYLNRANHTGSQLLSTISDVTATAAEVNLLDLTALTTGHVLRATGATTAAWQQLNTSDLNNDSGFGGNGIYDVTNSGSLATHDLEMGNFDIFDVNNLAVGSTASIQTRYVQHISETYTNTDAGLLGGLQINLTHTPGTAASGGLVGINATSTTAGTQSMPYAYGAQIKADHGASNTVTTLVGVDAIALKSGTGSVSSAYALRANLQETGASNTITTGYGLYIPTATGDINNIYGISVLDQTAAGSAYGVRLGLTEAANKYNIYADGTADNYLLGETGIGILPVTNRALVVKSECAGCITTEMRNSAGSTVFSQNDKGELALTGQSITTWLLQVNAGTSALAGYFTSTAPIVRIADSDNATYLGLNVNNTTATIDANGILALNFNTSGGTQAIMRNDRTEFRSTLVFDLESLEPTGYEGGVFYDTDDNKLKYHNGISWGFIGEDNLGNHTATQDITMTGFDLVDGTNWIDGDTIYHTTNFYVVPQDVNTDTVFINGSVWMGNQFVFANGGTGTMFWGGDQVDINTSNVTFNGKNITAGFSLGVRGNTGNTKGMDQGTVSSNLSLYNGGVEGLRQNTSGQVGIGRTPGYMLDVELPAASGVIAGFRDNAGGSLLIYSNQVYDPNAELSIGSNSVGRALWFRSPTSNDMITLQGNNIGIFDNTPDYTLDVVGETRVTDDFAVDGTTPTIKGFDTDINFTANELTAFANAQDQFFGFEPGSTTTGGLVLNSYNNGGSATAWGLKVNHYSINNPLSGGGGLIINSALHDGAGGLTSVGTGATLLQARNNGVVVFTVNGEGTVTTADDFSASNGGGANPAYKFTSETNTGMYLNGAGKLQFNVLGTGILSLQGTRVNLEQQAVFLNASAEPTGVEGGVFYDTDDNKLKLFNGVTWELVGAAGSGITSLNGLVTDPQTFATGTAGTDFAINSTGSTHTFNIPDASATARGLITTGAQTIGGNKTFADNIIMDAASAIQTSTGAGNTLLLQAYDVDGVAYTTFGTLTANNTPTFDLTTSVTVGGAAIAYAGGAFHDGFSDFVANEHIDHSGVSITAGVGLAGGGDITTTRSLDFDFSELTSSATITGTDEVIFQDATVESRITFALFESTLNHDNLAGFLANEHIDWTSTASNFSTSGTAATGALTVTGNIGVTGTVDGRDIATDGARLDDLPTATKGFTIESPSATEDVVIWYTNEAITITRVTDVAEGTSPSVTYNIEYASTRTGATTNLWTAERTTTSTTGTTTTTFNNANISAGSWIMFKTSAVSGTNDAFHVTIEYVKQ